MFKKLSVQRGQAIVLFAIAILGMMAMVALAIDSANAYSGRRKAQTSSDNAALAAALKLTSGMDNLKLLSEALKITRENGFADADVTFQHPVGEDCRGNIPDPVNHSNPRDNANYYVQVVIRSTYETYFGPIIGVTQLESCVSAIARGKPILIVPPFNGNAVVGLDPNGLSFHAQSNAQSWEISGGGIFANGNAEDAHTKVTFLEPGDCVTAVGTISHFGSDVCKFPGSVDQKVNYPDDVLDVLPPEPDCEGWATESGGTVHPEAGHEDTGSVWEDGFDTKDDLEFAPGVYCIPNASGKVHGVISGVGVTFYISDPSFDLKLNGANDGFEVQAPTSGTYAGVLMFSRVVSGKCDQNMEMRGNGDTPFSGTIFLPSACINWLGNSKGKADKSQIIGYQIYTNGSANVKVTYNPDDNWKAPEPPMVELTH